VECILGDPELNDAYKEGMAAAMHAGQYPERDTLPYYCKVAGFNALVATEHAPDAWELVSGGSGWPVGLKLFNTFTPAHWTLADFKPGVCRRLYELPLWQCSGCSKIAGQDSGGSQGPVICSCGGMAYPVVDNGWEAAFLGGPLDDKWISQ